MVNILHSIARSGMLAAALLFASTAVRAQFVEVMKFGLSVLSTYGPDKCSTLGEMATQAGNTARVGVVGGAAVGAILGAAITGNPSTAGTWGLAGGALGGAGLSAAAANSQGLSDSLAGRDLYRRRDVEICKLVVATEENVKPTWENFSAANRTARCKLPTERMKITDEQIDQCMNSVPEFLSRLKRAMGTNARINLGACEVAAQIFEKYDRLILASAKPNQSVIGALTPECDGRDFPKKYIWVMP